MNVEQSISHLKKIGFRVIRRDGNYSIYNSLGLRGNYSERGLINYCRYFTSDNWGQSVQNSLIKGDYKRNSRAFVRDRLSHNDFDAIDRANDSYRHSNRRDYE